MCIELVFCMYNAIILYYCRMPTGHAIPWMGFVTNLPNTSGAVYTTICDTASALLQCSTPLPLLIQVTNYCLP